MNLNLSLLMPEWAAFGSLFVLLFLETLRGQKSDKGNLGLKLSIVGAAATFATVLLTSSSSGEAFGGMYILDPFARFFKAFFVLVLAGIIFISSRHFTDETSHRTNDFYLILWCTLMGLFFLVSANDLLVVFISLEIVTLSFYIMAAYERKKMTAIESGLKYLIVGSLASAFMIFGIALIYFAGGTTSLPEVRIAFGEDPSNRLMLLGMLFILSGLGFKVASVPFQLWVPDVYQGAPTPVVAFLSIGSKAAGFAVLMRLFFTVFPGFAQKDLLFTFLAIATLAYGNLAALVQTNMKRLLGYSSIGHAGYLLMGLIVGRTAGGSALLYYLIAYAVTSLAVFLVVTIIGKKTESNEISAYRGLAKRSPFLAACLFISLLSLAGVPPLAGFFGKFLILFGAIQTQHYLIAVLGALAVAVSLYYYLSIVRVMYFEDSSKEDNDIKLCPATKTVLGILIVGIFVVGIWQAPFYNFCQQAVATLF